MTATADFLLELLSEEIPARMQARARNDLARMLAEEFAKAGLAAAAIETFATPRRLALIARGLPLATAAVSEEVKGPRSSAPPQALEGFLRKTGLTQDQLVERDGVWFGQIDKAGQATSNVLGPAIERIVRGFPWPKSMRWGAASASTASLRWVRPLHGIVALLGDELVPVDVDGIASGASTVGHRFHHPGPITLGGAHDYVEKLRACHVVVDPEERAALIRDRAQALAAEAGLELVADEGLVAENAGLTEWPVPLLGRFDSDYLDVPPEVIQLTARVNQKYFVLRGNEGALANAFICTANIEASDGGKAIVAGNQRVLAARLSDARFFWEQDLKIPLEEQAQRLSQIVFHEKLGTVADKVERVAKLARWLVEEGVVAAQAGTSVREGAASEHAEIPASAGMTLAAQAERAARLAKADLVTGMVGEFPELQGLIGGYLAEAQGEPKAVAEAIRDHYKPVGQGDDVPTAPVTVAVSLADKLDSIVAFFVINEAPTGSKDPFALRRAALGMIALIVQNNLRLGAQLAAVEAFGNLFERTLDADRYYDDQKATDVLWFLAERLKVQQREAGVRHDLIDAVFALGGEDDLVRLLARVAALQAFVTTDDGRNLLAGYKRAANILRKEEWDLPRVMATRGEQGMPQTGEEDPLALVEEPAIAAAVAEMALGSPHNANAPAEEQTLVAALEAAEPTAAAAVAREDFAGAMGALASLRTPIDAFFEQVTVNDPDKEVRARRLNLLARFRAAVHTVADFSKIEG
ncbi:MULTISPECIES: glycine--tRNA ligase subunit beta [Sphingomonas]|uniref:glycine--tRNA ligase subunit beta n=1 Tax=Sphingomonas TaxID=13687 RepID=UPI000DEEE3D8|nr:MULTISPECIES: glycine--tRNA ligase subunit beta [Sphingomonas]